MRAGDTLILTKALGTGTLLAADMQQRARGMWINAAIDSMLQSNQQSAAIFVAHAASACTDVTGFGLTGHLIEMLRASDTAAEINMDSLPILSGAVQTSAQGILSSLQPENLRLRRGIVNIDEARQHRFYPMLFDPQTAGGLLASVPAAHSERCVVALHAAGYTDAAVIGEVTDYPGGDERITAKL